MTTLEKNPNLDNSKKPTNRTKKGIITIATAIALLFGKMNATNAETTVKDAKQNNTEQVSKIKAAEIKEIGKDSIAINYLQKNLYVKGAPITDPKLNSKIEALGNDEYRVSYDHSFEGIPNFSEPTTKNIELHIKFTYKDNNIYISFNEIKLGKYQLEDNGTITTGNTVYDYDIVEGENKTLDINTKANEYKTKERIFKLIGKEGFNSGKVKNLPELENTQITKLNDIILGTEIFKDGENYYREINFNENGKYRPVVKVFFDKYGKIDMNKTKEEIEKTSFKILGIDIKFNITEANGTIDFSISDNSKKELIEKVKSDRKAIINAIDIAKVGPNKDFVGFNKKDEPRIRNNNEKMWLFDTKLISLTLVNDNYQFQRGKKADQILRFTVDSKEGGKPTVQMKNGNNQTVSNTFVTIDNDYYKITLKGEQLSIEKIKKAGKNITEHMPEYTGDREVVSTITDKTDSYFEGNNLQYFRKNGDLATEIKCKKDEKGEYSIEKQSTNIDIVDLYNCKRFKSITKDIEKLQKKENTLDIDLMKAFSTILEKNGVKLEGQNVIKVKNSQGEVYYCTVDKKFNVQIDEKLYSSVEKSLNALKKRLEIVNNISNAKMYWKNRKDAQNFEEFVGGGRGIGKTIAQADIVNFISKGSDQLDVDILWGEGQETTITYEYGTKFKIILKGKQKITIDGQEYKVKVDEKGSIYLDPIEIR